MRYRIYFEALQPIEVEAFDLRVTGARRIACKVSVEEMCTVDLCFPCEIKRIADNHDRDIYIK